MIKTLRNLLKQDKERFVVPRGVQDVIPIKAIYDDGIFQVGRDIYLHTDSEHDVQVLRERFLVWKNRSACEQNRKY